MPTKILTDQPQFRRRTLQLAITSGNQTVVEAPYFSVPLTDEDFATVDPADPDRELRPGEIFLAAPIVIANTTTTPRTVDVEIVGENGTPVMSICPTLTVPGRETLVLPPGFSLFKRDLANPNNAGMLMRVRGEVANALVLTTTVVEREALEHAPDTES